MAKTSDGKSIIGSGGPKRSLPKLTRKNVVILLVALLLIAGAVFAFLQLKRSDEKPKVKATTACTDPSANNVLNEAAPLLEPKKHRDLAKVVDKIKKLEGHDRDPNCLAVIVQYYVNISDAKNTEQYANKLHAVYSPEKNYDQSISAKVLTPDELKPIVEFLNKRKEQIERNSIQGPEVK